MRPALAFALLTAAPAAAYAQPPLEALPSILQLQLSQHPAWRAYKDAAAEQKADAARAAGEAAQLNAMTTPERLDALRLRLEQQRLAFERQAAATAAFYAVLSPEQKHTFDDVTRLPAPRPPLPPRTRADPGVGSGYAPSLRVPPADAPLPPPG